MRGGVSLVILGCLVSAVLTIQCNRTPEGFIAPKTPADNRFQLKISGSPEKYVPGEGYTVSLVGQRSPGHGQVTQKFTGFSLVVESQNSSPLRVISAREITPRPIGTFNLYGDSMTKFSPSCPNMVTHTSSMPKTEVQVRWTAPPPGSGCVIFRATVMEHRDVWYQDDGPLSKMLCEEVQENLDLQPQIIQNCCACEEAKYEVTFEGLWSRHTHPKDFPSNSWLTRFSDIIGASHSPQYTFWEYGGFASPGLRQVAERGSTRVLESELKANSGEIRTIIKARGISYPNVTGKTFAVFRVNKHHHLMSLVSMIDPSPDWIVGVSALELCLENCSWVESKILNLYPWDAGTDSGITYISPDQQTSPPEKIRRITSSFPNDPRSPFYDPSGLEMKPLARLYLTRQRLYEKTCGQDSQSVADGCEVSEWSAWGPCNRPCGDGKKIRRRNFRHSGKDCPDTKLIETVSCVEKHCWPDVQPVQEPEEDPRCDVGEWSGWSRCMPVDSSCKRGIQTRTRQVEPRDRRKYCLKVSKLEEKPCTLNVHPSVCKGKVFYKHSQTTENPDYMYGSEENNITTDEDFYDGKNDNGDIDENNGNETGGNGDGEGTEEQNVGEEEENGGAGSDGNEENGDGNEENGDGNEDKEGNGEGDGEEEGGGKEDGGDTGNEEENTNGGIYGGSDENDMQPEELTDECQMSSWSSWTPCSVTCGVGVKKRTRELYNQKGPRVEYQGVRPQGDSDYGTYEDETDGEYAEEPCSMYKVMEVEACNGTHESCQLSSDEARAELDDQTTTEEPTDGDEDLVALGQTRDLFGVLVQFSTDRPVRDCKLSEWSTWSECRAPCKQHGTKERTRKIKVHAKNGGKACVGKMKKEKKCFRRCRENERGQEEVSEEDKRNNGRCQYDDWSNWTECTATCGMSAVRQRTRLILSGNPTECTDRVQKQHCDVGACPQ